ncbi:hypothetical protein BN946_scf184663.g5 [Trametes cinnabarina]|uniref:Uncharacterized protein n=1 Tax=Pycnoporus cinnabarinus TaxID=5643 RepID=A0A060SQ21_PYCCI|nr:hypothetical protein BN946_scf184663.g5 [Trametes cinnabarina]
MGLSLFDWPPPPPSTKFVGDTNALEYTGKDGSECDVCFVRMTGYGHRLYDSESGLAEQMGFQQQSTERITESARCVEWWDGRGSDWLVFGGLTVVNL